jgi:hypothetical protein
MKETRPEAGETVMSCPSLEECQADPLAFNRVTMLMYRESPTRAAAAC